MTVVRNATLLGYPLYYSIKSVIDACDEFVVSEGFSEDSTMDTLRRLQEEFPTKVRITRDRWRASRSGETIAEITNNTLERCAYNWIYYLQADEFVHQNNLNFIASVPKRFNDYRSVSFRFTHFRTNLLFEMIGGYARALRMVRNYSRPWRKNLRRLWNRSPPGWLLSGYDSINPIVGLMDAYSIGDGWTFSGNVHPVFQANNLEPVFHVGYVSKDQGSVAGRLESHAKLLYPNLTSYQKVARALRAGKGVESWRAQGLRIVSYNRSDYPRTLLDWADEEDIDYVRDR